MLECEEARLSLQLLQLFVLGRWSKQVAIKTPGHLRLWLRAARSQELSYHQPHGPVSLASSVDQQRTWRCDSESQYRLAASLARGSAHACTGHQRAVSEEKGKGVRC